MYWKDAEDKIIEYLGEKEGNLAISEFGKTASVHTRCYIGEEGTVYCSYWLSDPPKWVSKGPYYSRSLRVRKSGYWVLYEDDGVTKEVSKVADTLEGLTRTIRRITGYEVSPVRAWRESEDIIGYEEGETLWQVHCLTGKRCHKGKGPGCIWTDWEV